MQVGRRARDLRGLNRFSHSRTSRREGGTSATCAACLASRLRQQAAANGRAPAPYLRGLKGNHSLEWHSNGMMLSKAGAPAKVLLPLASALPNIAMQPTPAA